MFPVKIIFIHFEYQWLSLCHSIISKINPTLINEQKTWKDNSLKKYKWPINVKKKSLASFLIEELQV